QRLAEKVFNQIIKFAGYGFNKSHSTGYALISYQTAYLKTNHPLEFMAALLTSEIGNADKITEYIEECSRMHIWILPPCVEESFAHFTVFGNDIRFGLAAVKNVGFGTIESIVRAREKDGPFKNFFDFCRRVDLRTVNKKVMESLIKAGAFDFFNIPRSWLTALVPYVLNHVNNYQKKENPNQPTLLTVAAPTQTDQIPQEIVHLPEWTEGEILSGEKEVLGFYFSGHPLVRYEKVLKRFASQSVRDVPSFKAGTLVRLGGIMEKVQKLISKKTHKRMASFVFEDLSGKVETIAFPDAFEKF
ncbi:MAG: DNA polymerase III subunit alpha, partial [bacterium (Candidatus Ratteibacteria) CG23_combo_of_CG06-09_8_20_14_all_48_7]